jgi:hypothetical protein
VSGSELVIAADTGAVNTPLDRYLSLRGLAGYSSLSIRTLRTYISDPLSPLPCYRIGGKILVRVSEFDGWLAARRDATAPVDVRRIVDEMLGTKKAP